MRGSLVVLALAMSPFVVRVSQAQGNSHVVRHEGSARADAKKCDERQRGNPSSTGLGNRADPRAKGNKDCATTPAPVPPPSTTGHTDVFGTLFNDLDGSGYQDAGEPGLGGWTVQLSGPSSQTVTTDGSGAYSFSGLSAGMYTVCAVPPSSSWALTAPSGGPSCSSGFGFSIEAPDLVGDVWYSGVDFGFKSTQ